MHYKLVYVSKLKYYLVQLTDLKRPSIFEKCADEHKGVHESSMLLVVCLIMRDRPCAQRRSDAW